MSLWLAVLLVLGILIYVIANVISNMRKSERDWQRVDKSKLKKWDDEDD